MLFKVPGDPFHALTLQKYFIHNRVNMARQSFGMSVLTSQHPHPYWHWHRQFLFLPYEYFFKEINIHIKYIFFSIWVFFHEHWRFTGQQGKGETISLTPLYHFHPSRRHLDISRTITAESSPLHKTSSRTRNGNL